MYNEPAMPVDRITVFCFGASYALALLIELVRLARPLLILRVASLAFTAAGLLAHTLYLAVQGLSLSSPSGSMLLLAFILAVFFLSESIHHRRTPWGIFVLPLVLG